MTYTIRDLSKMFQLPASTLRYYEKIGLLENVEHVQPNRRIYNESHVARLNAVECFKKALLPLDEIKAFFTYEKNMTANATKIIQMMKEQEKKTSKTLQELEIGLAHLQRKIKYYSLIDEALKNNTPLPRWKDITL